MPQTRILILEIDRSLAEGLVELVPLYNEKYMAVGFHDAQPALEHVQQYGLPDLAIIDMAPIYRSNLEAAQQLKAMADVPIICITGDDRTETILQVLKYAEDVVLKPCDFDVLLSRMDRVLRRFPPLQWNGDRVICVDDYLSVDFPNTCVYVQGDSVTLTTPETALLHTLMRYAGRMVENRYLIARAWRQEQVSETQLHAHMRQLQRKLQGDYICKVGKIGYQFTVTPE